VRVQSIFISSANQIADGSITDSKLATPQYSLFVTNIGTTSSMGGGTVNQGATRYTDAIRGVSAWNAAEISNYYCGYLPNCTVKKIWVNVVTNGCTAASSMTLRNVTSASDLGTITITGATAGRFEATGLSGTITDTDYLNWKIVAGAGGTNINILSCGIEYSVTGL